MSVAPARLTRSEPMGARDFNAVLEEQRQFLGRDGVEEMSFNDGMGILESSAAVLQNRVTIFLATKEKNKQEGQELLAQFELLVRIVKTAQEVLNGKEGQIGLKKMHGNYDANAQVTHVPQNDTPFTKGFRVCTVVNAKETVQALEGIINRVTSQYLTKGRMLSTYLVDQVEQLKNLVEN